MRKVREGTRSVGGQSEKDSMMEELEKKVAGLEKLRKESIAMENTLEETNVGGVVTGETGALNSLLRNLETAHKASIEEIRAEKDRKISELRMLHYTMILNRSKLVWGRIMLHDSLSDNLTGSK